METYEMKKDVIKTIDPDIVIQRPAKKTVLLCLNGFQNSDTHDATPMMDYFNGHFAKDYEGCEVVPVHLFYPARKETHHHRLFEKEISKYIQEYAGKGYDIILLGYSFSASLSCKMAHKYRKYVKRLILVAPVYDTIRNGLIPHYIKYAWKFHKLSKKYGARMAKAMGRNTTEGLFGLLVSIFSSILANRHYVRKVRQDALVIHGDKDLLCTDHSIDKVMKKLRGNVSYYSYSDMTHGIMKSLRENGIVYEDILNFCFDTPYLLSRKEERKNVVMESEKLDEDGERIPSFSEIFTEMDPQGEEESLQEQDCL